MANQGIISIDNINQIYDIMVDVIYGFIALSTSSEKYFVLRIQLSPLFERMYNFYLQVNYTIYFYQNPKSRLG